MGFPKECVDHINGDGLDNRRTNLRCCTNQQNQFNQKPRRGKGAAKGTFFVKEMNRWRAYIYKDYKKINLGYFDTEEDAGKAYDAASVKLHGEFGRRNGY